MTNPTASDPATQLNHSSAGHAAHAGAQVVCAKCEHANSAQTRFCGECGARLWEPCAACGEPTVVDRRFCGGCGESLDEALQRLIDAMQAALADSEGLAQEGRYVEAAALLEPIRLVEHTALTPLSKEIDRQRSELDDRRKAAVESLSSQLDSAKQLLAAGELRKAFAAVDQTPIALRNNELRDLHQTLKGRIGQADQLRVQIKRGLKEKQFEGLAAAAQRLLELEPADPQVVQLAEKLRSKQSQIDASTSVALLQKACAALRSCDYGTAHQAIARMPGGELNDEQQKVLRGAKERVWLATHLARTRYLDAVCLKAAERFAKLQPQDEKAGSLVESLAKQRRDSMAAAPGQPIVWRKKAPPESRLGAPLLLAPTPKLLAAPAAAKGVPAGQLMTAYGLALQSIGEADHCLNLTPKKKSWLASRPRRAKPAPGGGWGIDIGASSLKAIHLTRDADGELSVESIVCLPYERGGDVRSKPELPLGTPGYVGEAIGKFLEDRDLSTAAVTIGAPGPWTLSRCFQLPFINEAKFDEAVRYEARMRIPLEPEKVVFDRIVTPLPEETDLDARAVTLVACASNHVTTLQERLERVKCKSLQITSNCVALLNVARALQAESAAADAVALIDVGAKTTNVAVAHAGGCWVRGLYHGADLFDHALVKQRQIGWDAAERLRREPWRDAWMHEVDECLAHTADDLAAALQRNLAQFHNESVATIEQHLLCGGGAQQIGLLRRLTTAD